MGAFPGIRKSLKGKFPVQKIFRSPWVIYGDALLVVSISTYSWVSKYLPSGKLTVCELENPPIFKFGKSTISKGHGFNSKL